MNTTNPPLTGPANTPHTQPTNPATPLPAPSGTSPKPLVKGRFAPTPSGRMHLGNVWCALVAWLDARSRGGELVLRIEDLDPRRTPAGAAQLLIEDLRWLGLDWDEGPIYQGERSPIYAQHLDRLVDAGLTYPCYCARADLHAAQAPHASDGTPIYAGTCKNLTADQRREREQARTPGIRLAVPNAGDPRGTIAFVDDVYGPQREVLARECGDFLVRRSDGIHAYQLAVTVDDALMGVTRVVRGQDLLSSTARQLYLQDLLGFDHPSYAHVPLLMAGDGSHRLSKRERDCDLGYMRQHFGRPEVLIGRLAHLTGLRPTPEPATAAELAQEFTWDAIRQRRDPICVPPSFFE